MLLLGAGASKVFGLKTLQDLTNDLVREMKGRGHEKVIREIIVALHAFKLTPDFENIYLALEGLTDPIEGIKKSGAFAAYIAHKSDLALATSGNTRVEFKEILSDFRDLIYKECTIQKGIIERERKVLDMLLRVTREYTEPRYLPSLVGSSGNVRIGVGDTMVTTNYDMAVELYHRWANIEIADGFGATREEYTKELDFGEYGRKASSHWLIKLHGSIWQFRQDRRIIQTIADPESLPLSISVGEQMMIYPIGEKPILQHPYFSFYYLFREQPWETLIAIGHSFRDDPINTAIIERLNTPASPKTKLIVINPHAEEVVAKRARATRL